LGQLRHDTPDGNVIIVVQYGWGVASYTRDLLVSLADAGYQVAFFIDEQSLSGSMIDVGTLVHPNVATHILSGRKVSLNGTAGKLVHKLVRLMQALLGLTSFYACREDISRVRDYMRNHSSRIRCVIGVERTGLIMATYMARPWACPWFYYSLEIYGDERPRTIAGWWSNRLLRRCRDQSSGTIVQDEHRARHVLYGDSSARGVQIYYPVSVRATPLNGKRNRSNYWNLRFGLPADAVVILYFGKLNVSARRKLSLFAEQMVNLDSRFVLIFHGSGASAELQRAAETAPPRRVFVSQDVVAEEDIEQLISSADIGLCYYANEFLNDRLTAFSSEKIALFLRSGVPIISADNESYRDLYGRYRCGECITEFPDFASKVVAISGDALRYREQSLAAFSEIFDQEMNVRELIAGIDNTCVCNVPLKC
jgi:glycosyltransferase involved in cell wall biosynthesis